MKETTRNFVVGLTAILGLVALCYMIVLFGEVPVYLQNTYFIQIHLDDANGLANGARVKFAGLDVGDVEKIVIKDDPAEGVLVTCNIEKEFKIPTNAIVVSEGSILGGAAQVKITPAPRKEGEPIPPSLPQDGTGELRGVASSVTAALTEMAQRLEVELTTQLRKFGDLSDKVIALADEYQKVGENANKLLEQRDPASVDAGMAKPNLSTILARADSRMGELKATLDNINKVLGDKQMLDDLRATLANAKGVTGDARKVAGKAELLIDDARKAADNINVKLGQLTDRYVAVADDLSKTLAEMNGLLADARAGKGSLGRLMQDPQMYNSLTDAANRLSDALKEAKLLLEKWKTEGLDVKF
ncbi:MAG: MCE family protein [Phycisphaera sp.]|nr:MCE family protein [Phycisphaera sp.]